MEKYWADIDRLNKLDHIFADSSLTMDVKGNSSFFDVLASAYDTVNLIESSLESLQKSDESLQVDFGALLAMKGISSEIFNDIPYYENPFKNRNWESHNIGTPNFLQRLRIDLLHIEVKYLEEYLKTNSDDTKVKTIFEKAKDSLKDSAKTAMCLD